MSLSVFPDVNVWLALSVSRHVHHPLAREWFEGLEKDCRFHFCRFTQLGLLRLLSLEAVMGPGEALSQRQAWAVYDRWREDARVRIQPEPDALEPHLRHCANAARPAPQAWSDDYLLAFADAAGLRLATLDRALARRSPAALLVGQSG